MEIFEIFESARGAYTRCARRVVVEISGRKKEKLFGEFRVEIWRKIVMVLEFGMLFFWG